jgi:hypothetical protein
MPVYQEMPCVKWNCSKTGTCSFSGAGTRGRAPSEKNIWDSSSVPARSTGPRTGSADRSPTGKPRRLPCSGLCPLRHTSIDSLNLQAYISRAAVPVSSDWLRGKSCGLTSGNRTGPEIRYQAAPIHHCHSMTDTCCRPNAMTWTCPSCYKESRVSCDQPLLLFPAYSAPPARGITLIPRPRAGRHR